MPRRHTTIDFLEDTFSHVVRVYENYKYKTILSSSIVHEERKETFTFIRLKSLYPTLFLYITLLAFPQ